MKKAILFLLLSVLATNVYSQLAQHRIFSKSRNELATKIKTLPNGHAIIGGYIYDLENGSVANADMFLLRVDANGHILGKRNLEPLTILQEMIFLIHSPLPGMAI